MKKVFAIIGAVALAFVIALGDQIIRVSFSDIPFFGGSSDEFIIPEKPKIPQIVVKKPEEVNLSYDERIEKGDYYFDRGFLTYASNEYVKAANLEPERTEPYLKLVQANLELMDYGRARKNSERILEIEPNHFETKYHLILISIKQSDFRQAITRTDELLNAGLTDSRLLYLKAILSIAHDQHEEGKDLLKQLIADPTAGSELIKKAQKILAGYEEFEFAQAAEELYLSELLARSFSQIDEYELAIFKLKEILRDRSDLRDAWIMLGFSYLNLEKYLFALSSFDQAYELDSSWPATQYFLGLTYSELSQFDDAIIYMNYAIENGFEPKVVVEQKLADLYLETENYVESVKAYEEILEYSPQDVNAFVRPIWIYLDFLHEPAKAMKLGEMAVMTFPENPMAYNLLGWSQTGTKNYVEAEKNLLKSIDGAPEVAAPHYNLAKLYEEMKKDDLAMDEYQKAYEFDQNGSIGNLAAKRFNALMMDQ